MSPQVLDTPTGSGKSLVAVAALFQALGKGGPSRRSAPGSVGADIVHRYTDFMYAYSYIHIYLYVYL